MFAKRTLFPPISRSDEVTSTFPGFHSLLPLSQMSACPSVGATVEVSTSERWSNSIVDATVELSIEPSTTSISKYVVLFTLAVPASCP